MNRKLSLALIALILCGAGCSLDGEGLPTAGLALYRSHWVQEVGDFKIDLAGGNGRYTIEAFRNGMDTSLGTYGFAFTYNSANRSWSSEFEMTYNGALFVDDTGGEYDLGSLVNGAEVPGTHWIKLNSQMVLSRGGRRYEFDPATAELKEIIQRYLPYPKLLVSRDRVQHCQLEDYCEDLFVITRNGFDQITGITSRDRAASISWDQGMISSLQQSGDVQAGRAGFQFEYEQAEYDQQLLEAIVNPAGERLEIAYQGERVAQVVQVGEGDPTYTFDYGESDGLQEVVVTDPRGGERKVRYSGFLTVASEQNPEGEMSRWIWAGKEIHSKTTPGGEITTWLRAGDTLTETQPSGNVVVTRYIKWAVNSLDYREYAITHREDSVGFIEHRAYEPQGRVSSITDAEGYREDFTYGRMGAYIDQIWTHAEFAPVFTSFSNYDWHGHHGTVLLSEALPIFRSRVYNEAGDLLNGDDLEPEGAGRPGVVENRFDHSRHIVEKELAFSWPNETVYMDLRFDGRPKEITRPYGGRTSFGYDALGRLISQCEVVDGVDECTTFAYDLSSNVVLTTKGDGATETRLYDYANREIAVLYAKPGAANMSATTHYADGRVDWREDSAYGMQKEHYSYASDGSLSAIDFPDGKRLEADSDLRSRLSEIRYLVPDGFGGFDTSLRLGFGYDLKNRRTHVYEDGVLLVQDTYESARIVERWTANGSTKSWLYTSGFEGGMLWLTGTSMASGSAESWILRDWDQVRVLTNVNGLATGPIDDLEELYHILDVYYFDDIGTYVEGWGDDDGFYLAPELGYAYDALGNVTEVYSFSGTSTHPTSQVTWNTEHNRVVSAIYDGQTIDYVYNGAGEVVERGGVEVERNAMGAVVGYGPWWAEKDTRGRFVSLAGVPRVFGGRMEADANGDPTALDYSDARIELASGTNTHYFKYYDFRNNLQRIDDDSGTPVVLYRYDPFGVADVYGTLPGFQERTFAQGLTMGSGLVLTGRRVLDPACKCYWSNDPIFDSVNQVAYTPNPIALWDPTGEWAIKFKFHFGPFEVEIEVSDEEIKEAIRDLDRAFREFISTHCGLGFEVALVMPAFLWLHGLRRRRKQKLLRNYRRRLPES